MASDSPMPSYTEFLEYKKFIQMKASFKPLSSSAEPYQPQPKDVDASSAELRPWYMAKKEMNYAEIGRNAFMKAPIDSSHKFSLEVSWFYALRQVCELNPDNLIVIGSIHNSADGTRTYLSAKVKGLYNLYYNLHMYGIASYNYFKVTEIEIFLAPRSANAGSVVLKVVDKPRSKDNISVASSFSDN
jgi:hypothetical protein